MYGPAAVPFWSEALKLKVNMNLARIDRETEFIGVVKVSYYDGSDPDPMQRVISKTVGGKPGAIHT